jgi:glycosyltransferase involved in cell wall biosynthesis
MKICIVGYFVDNPVEGVRNTTNYIIKELESQGIEVKKINIESFSFIYDIIKFRPNIVHYILTPTSMGIIITRLISLVQPKSLTIISAMQTSISRYKLLSIFRPNIAIVQSYDSEYIFKTLGCKTFFLTPGVDIDKFKPVDKATKQILRKKYGISHNKFIIIHMASLKKERNLDIFQKLQRYANNVQVIIIGRPGEKIDKNVYNSLTDAGCIIWMKYFPNIEEIYAISDCYVFPTTDKKACIETPLSILEAMACNLPIITTRFGSIPRMFRDDKGLFFAKSDDDFYRAIDIIKNRDLKIYTRDKVKPYSWNKITKELLYIYEDCIKIK